MNAADNLRAGLSTIAECEGTNTPDGYRALFGYHPTRNPTRLFDNDFARHPNIRCQFTQTDGTINYTTAAGRYQIIFPTWSRLAAKLGLTDFSPQSQDLAALELIAEAGALLDLQAGDIQAFSDKCSTQWASLPASHYLQPKKTLAFAEAAFVSAGGVMA
jgi:lysozyme